MNNKTKIKSSLQAATKYIKQTSIKSLNFSIFIFNKTIDYLKHKYSDFKNAQEQRRTEKAAKEKEKLILQEKENKKNALIEIEKYKKLVSKEGFKILPSGYEKFNSVKLKTIIESEKYRHYLHLAKATMLINKLDEFMLDLSNRVTLTSKEYFKLCISSNDRKQVVSAVTSEGKKPRSSVFSAHARTPGGFISNSIAAGQNAALNVGTDGALDQMELSIMLGDLTDRERFYYRAYNILYITGIMNRKQLVICEACLTWNNGKGNVSWIGDDKQNKYYCYAKKGFVGMVEQLGPTSQIVSIVNSMLKDLEDDNEDNRNDNIINFINKPNKPWLNPSDLINSQMFGNSKNSLYLGTFDDGEKLLFKSDRSLLTVAPPGSGKTLCQVIPNLLSYVGSVVVLDVKGECADKSIKYRDTIGRTIEYNPTNAKNSANYNPLSNISTDKNKIWKDCILLANMMILPGDGKDKHFDNRAADILTAILAYVCLNEDEPNIDHVLDYISCSNEELAVMAESLCLHGEEIGINAITRAAKAILGLLNDDNDTLLLQYQDIIRGNMSIWEEQNVIDVSSKSDWSPKDLHDPDQIVSLYIKIPPSDIESYSSVLRVILAQHIRFAMSNKNDTKLPLLYILDEFPRLGQMDPILELIETGRSYGLKTWLFTQNLSQIKKYYTSSYESIVEGVGVQMYMNPTNETAKTISEILGKKHDLIREKEIPLASPNELSGPEFRDNIISLAHGEKPAKLVKVFNNGI